MSETLRMWMEITFNILYLITVWALVIAMQRRLNQTRSPDTRVGRYFIWAFGLLALGDTGHVGFRVWAYSMGDLEATISLFGRDLGLVGLGALSTAVTVTLFYVVMLFIWSARFQRRISVFGGILVASAVVRLVIMTFPQNQWNLTVPPQPWSLWRNLPLIALGLGVAFLTLRDAIHRSDLPFQWIGIMILISYAFYVPVILFVQQVPAIGMLMIPKTMAYVAIAAIAYLSIFRGSQSAPAEPVLP